METLSNEPILTIYFSETVKRTRKYSRHSNSYDKLNEESTRVRRTRTLGSVCSSLAIRMSLYHCDCTTHCVIASELKYFLEIAANWALMKNETDQKIISHENMNLSGLNSDGFRENVNLNVFKVDGCQVHQPNPRFEFHS